MADRERAVPDREAMAGVDLETVAGAIHSELEPLKGPLSRRAESTRDQYVRAAEAAVRASRRPEL